MSVLSAVPADGCAPAIEIRQEHRADHPCIVEEVVLGVDTHLKTHTAVLVDLLGRQVDAETFATTKRGNEALITWAQRRGSVQRAGVEGTGSYGVALARRLKLEGIRVFEVTRPKRKRARHRGKNDAARRAGRRGQRVG